MQIERGLAIGVFDLFHIGHLRYLQYASSRCRHLIVAVTADQTADEVKGRLPLIHENHRLEILRAFDFVSEARLQPCSTEETQCAVAWIVDWQIEHVVAGGGWQGSSRWGRLVPALNEQGITVEFAPATKSVSTTEIIQSVVERFSPDGAGR